MNPYTRGRFNIYETAMEEYGETAQIFAAIEEFNELCVQLAKRHNNKNTVESVIEELADAELMLEQMKMLFGSKKFEIMKEFKLGRLAQRLNMTFEQVIEDNL